MSDAVIRKLSISISESLVNAIALCHQIPVKCLQIIYNQTFLMHLAHNEL